MEHRRGRLQEAEREWRHQSSSPVRDVYWQRRYTPPPRAPRPGRVVLGLFAAIGVPLACSAMVAVGALDRTVAGIVFIAVECIGLYLICTAEE